MDFQYTPEQDAFRAEVRDWLAANLDPALCVDDPKDERVAPDRETFEKRRLWQRAMYAGGWVGCCLAHRIWRTRRRPAGTSHF